ncbi:hypothetical protein ACS0TY_024745 [Phlomoides rotata]
MTHFCSKYCLMCLLLMCFFLLVVRNSAEFPRIKHSRRKNGDSISFLVVGDWGRGGFYNQSKVAYQMGRIGKKLDIDFVISTGDNFYKQGLKGVDDPFFKKSFTNIYTAKSLSKPWYTVLGNHDYLGDVEAQLSPALRRRDKRWICKRNYVVGAGFWDIVFVDTNPLVQKYFNNPKNETFDWRNVLPRDKYISYVVKNLDLALQKSKARWKVVVGHHTIRSNGYHGDTQEIVDQILPILKAHKVSMYMNGHDHCLQHFSNNDGSMQFLTSGGGSKAWKNIFHQEMRNDTIKHFYYDGQGFMSVKLSKKNAKIAFYDVFGKPLHFLSLGDKTTK